MSSASRTFMASTLGVLPTLAAVACSGPVSASKPDPEGPPMAVPAQEIEAEVMVEYRAHVKAHPQKAQSQLPARTQPQAEEVLIAAEPAEAAPALELFEFSGSKRRVPDHSGQGSPVTVEDCIEMVRIQQTYDQTDRTVAFSPDGSEFATLIWQGDLEKNTNHYTVLVFDARNPNRPANRVLTVDYSHDARDQHARPVTQMSFVKQGSALAFIATFNGMPRQVYTLDLATKTLQQVTHHPHGVRAFAMTPDGSRVVFAAETPPSEATRAALTRDGFSLYDPRLTAARGSLLDVARGEWIQPEVRVFLLDTERGEPVELARLTSNAPPKVWMSPSGQSAVVGPYVAAADETLQNGRVPGLALVNLQTGHVEQLVDVFPSAYRGRVLWPTDETRVLVWLPPKLHEVNIRTKQTVEVAVGAPWDLVGWKAAGEQLIFARSGHPREGRPEETLATLARAGDGWGQLVLLPSVTSKYTLNPRYPVATNGELIVGVKDDLVTPPELAVYDLETHETRVVTDLNPKLRAKAFGETTRIRWSGPYDEGTSFGYLIKPVNYVPGRRYPLIVQIKDEGYYPEDNSFIIDGQEQYSGAAIQPLANLGFVVLFTPWPLSAREVMETPEEAERFLTHIETGIDHLDRLELIDTSKIAITGWSRAGFMTLYTVVNSKRRFLAATMIDNIKYLFMEYILWGPRITYERQLGGLLPWGPRSQEWREQAIDFKLDRINTPMLIEAHDRVDLSYGEVLTALRLAGTPVDLYVYPGAAHSLKSPRHRWASMKRHIDWFRFWLQDYEDPAPGKQERYRRWRRMREAWKDTPTEAPSGDGY